jgi:hypothetical protein
MLNGYMNFDTEEMTLRIKNYQDFALVKLYMAVDLEG